MTTENEFEYMASDRSFELTSLQSQPLVVLVKRSEAQIERAINLSTDDGGSPCSWHL